MSCMALKLWGFFGGGGGGEIWALNGVITRENACDLHVKPQLSEPSHPGCHHIIFLLCAYVCSIGVWRT